MRMAGKMSVAVRAMVNNPSSTSMIASTMKV